jgi:hypothetical protein
MTDIVERLRGVSVALGAGTKLCNEAADEIEALRVSVADANVARCKDAVEIERLRDALRAIADMEPGTQEWIDGTVPLQQAERLLGSVLLIARREIER